MVSGGEAKVPVEEAREMELELLDYLRVLAKRKLIIILLFVSSIVSSYIASELMTPIYEATTTILVKEPQPLLDPLLGELSGMNKNSTQNYAEVLKSRSLAQKVAEVLELGLDPNSPEFYSFKESISIQPSQGSDIMRISVQSEDPEKAKNVANALVSEFIKLNTEVNRTEARGAREFIEEQLTVVEKDLKAAEEALRAFKEQEKVVSPTEETKAALNKLAQLETMKAETQVALEESRIRLQEIRAELGRQEETIVSSTTISNNPLVQEYRSRLSELEIELAGAREQYTSVHPKVVALQAEIAQIEAKLNTEVERMVSAETRSLNPIHQGLLQQLIQLEAEVQALSAKYDAVERLIRENEKVFQGLPEKELELSRLTRNAQVTEEIYVMLLKKYEEIRITEAMKTSDIQVLDEAITPQVPIKPRKKLNVAIAGFLGLFVGVGLAFLLEYMDTSIKSAEEAEALLGLPVLGRIPAFDQPRYVKRRRRNPHHARSAVQS